MLDDGLFPLCFPGQAVRLVLPVPDRPGLPGLHLVGLVREDQPRVLLHLALHSAAVSQHHGEAEAVHQPH